MKPYWSVSGSSLPPPAKRLVRRATFAASDAVRWAEKSLRRPLRSETSVGGRDSCGSIESSSTDGTEVVRKSRDPSPERAVASTSAGASTSDEAFGSKTDDRATDFDEDHPIEAALKARLKADGIDAACEGCSEIPVDDLREEGRRRATGAVASVVERAS